MIMLKLFANTAGVRFLEPQCMCVRPDTNLIKIAVRQVEILGLPRSVSSDDYSQKFNANSTLSVSGLS